MTGRATKAANVYLGDLYDELVTKLPDVNLSREVQQLVRQLIRKRAECSHQVCECRRCGAQIRRDVPGRSAAA